MGSVHNLCHFPVEVNKQRAMTIEHVFPADPAPNWACYRISRFASQDSVSCSNGTHQTHILLSTGFVYSPQAADNCCLPKVDCSEGEAGVASCVSTYTFTNSKYQRPWDELWRLVLLDQRFSLEFYALRPTCLHAGERARLTDTEP